MLQPNVASSYLILKLKSLLLFVAVSCPIDPIPDLACQAADLPVKEDMDADKVYIAIQLLKAFSEIQLMY